MTDEQELNSARHNRVDVGWRGSTLMPRKKRVIEIPGVAGAQVAAQKLQKEEELKLGLRSEVDAKALRAKRRAEGSLGASNRGVKERGDQDKAAILTEEDRQRVLEDKSRTYDALQAGQMHDDSDLYHVEFIHAGQLQEERAAGPVPEEFQQEQWLHQQQQGLNLQGDMQSRDMQREAMRRQQEDEDYQVVQEEMRREAERDEKIAGTKISAKILAEDKAQAARAKAGSARTSAEDRAAFSETWQAALRTAQLLKARRKQMLARKELRKRQQQQHAPS